MLPSTGFILNQPVNLTNRCVSIPFETLIYREFPFSLKQSKKMVFSNTSSVGI